MAGKRSGRRQYVRDRLGRFARGGGAQTVVEGPQAGGVRGAEAQRRRQRDADLALVPELAQIASGRRLVTGKALASFDALAERYAGDDGPAGELARDYHAEVERARRLSAVRLPPAEAERVQWRVHHARMQLAAEVHARTFPPARKLALDHLMQRLQESDERSGIFDEGEHAPAARDAQQRRADESAQAILVESGWSNLSYQRALSDRLEAKQ